ncbi:glycoside hydrolase family 5 [Pyrrhoderma noxium]|uniref:glucan 1,3-beta-glucosidase n=1 Tax=Pyrrhoderma noxium TaxID=2282107 RepID=A0A286UVR6_9AGAM|nr:glycoside hydrolase family 5 [Pyrrhoderma noxium]
MLTQQSLLWTSGQHYKTFITEQDFAEIAGAGLNWVRIPLPYWAIEVRGDEPFLAKTCWTYFLKAIEWARKYGIRINLDLHALPGSQNGWNHSGKLGTINMLNGPMGYANAQRSLDYIRVIAEFISQPEYRDVVAMFGITNEPQASTIGKSQLQSYYLQAYEIVRTASGIGEGNGPMVSIHDGFLGLSNWAGFLPGADRLALDMHPYLAFSTQSSDPLSSFVDTPCTAWANNFNQSMSNFGLTGGGEFSNAINDCGWYVNGVNLGTRYEGTYTGDWPTIGSCDSWLDWESWDDDTKQNYKNYALSSMDALQNYFFWTWKIGNSTTWDGRVMSPQWSYKLGLENGWMPTDPREATGKCGGGSIFEGPLAASATGGAGAGTLVASGTANLQWPPATISNAGAVTLLPSYTPTASIPTLVGPTFTVTESKTTSTVSAGNGWQNAADTSGMMTDIASCTYLDPWVGPTASPPSPLCS